MFEWSFMKIHENLFFENLAKNPYGAKAIIHGFGQFWVKNEFP